MPTKKTITKKVSTQKNVVSKEKIVLKTSSKTIAKKTTTVKNNATNLLAVNSNFIDLDTANAMITTAANIDNRPAMDYPKEIIQDLLNIDGVIGLRIYNAIDSNNNKTYVIKGFDENGFDVHLEVNGNFGAIDMGQPCDPSTTSYINFNE